MFYFDSDKKEIKSWDDNLRKELLKKLSKYITQEQFQEYDNGYTSQFETLNSEIDSAKRSFVSSTEFNTLKEKVADLENKIQPPIDIEPLKQELDALKQKVAELPPPPPPIDITPLKQELDALKQKVAELPSPPPPIDITPFKQELDALKQKVAELPSPPPPIDITPFKQELDALKQKVAEIPSPQSPIDIEPLKKEVDTLRQAIIYQQRVTQGLSQGIIALKAQTSEIDSLKKELAAQKSEIDSLKKELTDSKQEIAAHKKVIENLQHQINDITPPPPPPPPFFLPEQKDVFITNDREQIPEKIKTVLDVGEIEKYLATNSSDNSKQFQKLLNNHLTDAKKVLNKLKLNDLDDEELSENVTAKYFKIFYGKMFDNLLVAIKRGLKNADEKSEKFYLGLLLKVNEYLTRCGIYSVNTTPGRKAEAEDYENMSPQTLKTTDKKLAGTISDIERLPYRINYLDEFGEQKYFQYAGIMNVYKAV